ncbi:DUF2441 domain-containing protein [Paenibacillus sp. QZ-Y1]|uniref:DUF2441 domain-containing protein n=1 Tax=Paenibacillus sp. QZ-Y1 TaxID=3414511 RepID=UPI003F7ACA99
MKAFHVDRFANLKEGQVVQLANVQIGQPMLQDIIDSRYPDGLSAHGYYYYALPSKEEGKIQDALAENVYEYERRLYFPHLPSRFQSIFASETIEEALEWVKIVRRDDIKPLIWEIEFDHSDYIKADSLLIGIDIKDVSLLSPPYHANRYWRGEPSDNPQYEMLIKLPVKVNKLIDY